MFYKVIKDRVKLCKCYTHGNTVVGGYNFLLEDLIHFRREIMFYGNIFVL